MRKLAVLLVLTFVSLPILYAGTTGKIAGRLIDSETKEPLAGADVIIQEISAGAASSPDGSYFIINVPVGVYSVTGQMIGYEPVTKSGVMVSADLTTVVDFAIKSTVIPLKGITVTAERPLIRRDATSTTHIVGGDQIVNQPVHNFQEVVAEQSGVVNSAGGASGSTAGLHLRGGRADEVAYMVDGMSIKDPITGQAGAFVSTAAIEEMAVSTGGFNAEYGQAMSGVVNVVTKETRIFEGLARYQTDRPFTGTLSEGSQRFQANLGGPLPLLHNLSYFISGEVALRNQLPGYFVGMPEGLRFGSMSNTDDETYTTQAKLAYRLTPAIKLNLSSFLSRNQGGRYAPFVGLPSLEQHSENDYKYLSPDWREARWRKAYQLTGGLTHQLGPKTFYNVHIGYFNTHTIDGLRNMVVEKNRQFWQDIQFRPWWLYTMNENRDASGIGWSEKKGIKEITATGDTIWDYYYPYGVPGIFRVGPAGNWEERQSSYYGLDFDITSQITSHHQLKFGFTGKRHNVSREEGQYIYTIKNQTIKANKDTTYSWITDQGDTVEIGSSLADSLVWLTINGDTVDVRRDSLVWIPPYLKDGRASWDIGDALYFDRYKNENPYEFAFFLQDKIEYEGFVINPGLRVDYFNPTTWRFKDFLYPYRDTVINGQHQSVLDTVSANAKWQFSPRIGIAFPVTPQTVFHVSYGHFFQMSRMRWLYDSYTTIVSQKRGAWGLIGNPDLGAQKTIQYEIGLSHELTLNTALTATAFYKDLYNLIGTRLIPAIPNSYTAYLAEDYGNVRGVELTLERQATRYLSGQLSYTLQYAKGTSSWERSAYYDYISNVPIDPYTGLPFQLPKIDYPLEFDQRHTIAANINLLLPDDLKEPFRNISVTAITNLGSGLPYTERDKRNYIVGVTNAQRMPWTFNADLRISKEFRVQNLRFSIFAEVTNIFNNLNIQNLYPNTGKPDDNQWLDNYNTYIDGTFPKAYLDQGKIPVYKPGGEHTFVSADERRDLNRDGYITLDEWYTSYKNAFNDFVSDPFFYSSPRHINIGISFNW
jgi:hypothetical protein